MFDDLIKELNRMKRQTVSVPIETDDNGYLDKKCPSNSCGFLFKVNFDDWKNIVKDEAVWCPMCRHEAPADQWFTEEQIEHASAEAMNHVEGRISKALCAGANKFNQRQRSDSFIKMTMTVTAKHRRSYMIPAKAAEVMQHEIVCEVCNARYAVIGSAYFCPACGHNSVTRTFFESLRKIRAKLDGAELVRNTLEESQGKDEAELICRSLVETSISDGVVAFQKFCEGKYANFGKSPQNAFQRLQQGSDLWGKAIGHSYSDWLKTGELDTLNVLFQKRHLLAHQDGIIDARYIEHTGDTSYRVGQRIVISKSDVTCLISVIEKLCSGLKDAIEQIHA